MRAELYKSQGIEDFCNQQRNRNVMMDTDFDRYTGGSNGSVSCPSVVQSCLVLVIAA